MSISVPESFPFVCRCLMCSTFSNFNPLHLQNDGGIGSQAAIWLWNHNMMRIHTNPATNCNGGRKHLWCYHPGRCRPEEAEKRERHSSTVLVELREPGPCHLDGPWRAPASLYLAKELAGYRTEVKSSDKSIKSILVDQCCWRIYDILLPWRGTPVTERNYHKSKREMTLYF